MTDTAREELRTVSGIYRNHLDTFCGTKLSTTGVTSSYIRKRFELAYDFLTSECGASSVTFKATAMVEHQLTDVKLVLSVLPDGMPHVDEIFHIV